MYVRMYIFVCHQNVGQVHNLVTDKFFENVANFKFLERQ